MTFLENVLANVEADSYVFENYKEEACKKLENYFDQRYEPLLLLEGGAADHPSCFHEERGKLCGYAFERGDLVYRCKYAQKIFLS